MDFSVHAEVESAFQRLSSLLTVHTVKFNVLVTPLRGVILEVCVCLCVFRERFIVLFCGICVKKYHERRVNLY